MPQKQLVDANISWFKFARKPVRIVMQGSDPWFCAQDVADAIGHSKTSMMLELASSRHHTKKGGSIPSTLSGRVRTVNTATEGGSQALKYVSLQGLSSILIRSRLPKCQAFQHQLTSKVLPLVMKESTMALKKQVEQLTTKLVKEKKIIPAEEKTVKVQKIVNSDIVKGVFVKRKAMTLEIANVLDALIGEADAQILGKQKKQEQRKAWASAVLAAISDQAPMIPHAAEYGLSTEFDEVLQKMWAQKQEKLFQLVAIPSKDTPIREEAEEGEGAKEGEEDDEEEDDYYASYYDDEDDE